MADNVFILGAGASAESGAPVMDNFLDIAKDLFHDKKFDNDQEKIGQVFELIRRIQGVYANSQINLNNIEHLLGIIEMGQIVHKLGDLNEKEINDFHETLLLLIVRTLEENILFDIDRVGIKAPSYDKLINIINLLKENGYGDSSIITFNYDIAVDLALTYYYNIDYCIDENDIVSKKFKLLKLHGSMNWVYTNNDKILPSYIDPRSYSLTLNDRKRGKKAYSFREFQNDIKNKYKKETLINTAYIVPPTWNKSQNRKSIVNVWKEAIKQIQSARNIIIIGYSLPESDMFFRFLISIGLLNNIMIKKIYVYDKDKTRESVYKKLLGGALNNKFEFFDKSFTDAIRELQKIFNPSKKVKIGRRDYS